MSSKRITFLIDAMNNATVPLQSVRGDLEKLSAARKDAANLVDCEGARDLRFEALEVEGWILWERGAIVEEEAADDGPVMVLGMRPVSRGL